MVRLFVIVIALAMLFIPAAGFFAPTTSGQPQSGSCQVLTNWYTKTVSPLGYSSFQTCADNIAATGQLRNNMQVGLWGKLQIAIMDSTSIYYRQSSHTQWLSYGTVSRPIDGEETDDDKEAHDDEPHDEVSNDDIDNDGFVGSQDRCPQQAESKNGFADNDGCPDSLQDLIDTMTTDLGNFWQQTFANADRPYELPARVSTYNHRNYTQFTSACGPMILNNAFYCPLDQRIYLDEELLNRAMQETGDYAAAVIIAHEWAHQVQHQLHRLQNNRYTIFEELEADCLAGVYTKHAEVGSQLLEEGDLEEGAVKMYALGDFAPWFDPQAHGTPNQRLQSFLAGYRQGVSTCFSASN